MGETDTEKSERRERRKQARHKALKLLRDGLSPEQVTKRLLKGGLTEAEATRAVERADDRLQTELEETSRAACSQCGKPLAESATFCDACGTKVPDAATLHFHRTQIQPYLIKGRKWLGAMCILYALGGILFGVVMESMLVLAINMVLAGIQFGLWQWSKKNLLPAAITSLVLFVTLHLVDAVADPASLARGILVKVLFVIALAQAIRAGLEARAHGTGAVA